MWREFRWGFSNWLKRATTGAGAAAVTTLFFMWGFLTSLNDILVPHLKSIFDLNYAEVMLIQFAFFSAYFIFSLPSGKLIDRIGYKKAMVVGLVTMGVGRCCLSRRQPFQRSRFFLAH